MMAGTFRGSRQIVAVVATVALVGAACSGDDGDGGTASTAPTQSAPADEYDVELDFKEDEENAEDPEGAEDAEDAEDADATVPALPEGYEFDGALVSLWSPSEAAAINRTEDVVTRQLVQETLTPVVEGHWIWDSWPLRNPDGQVAEIDGWKFLFGLSAEITPDRVPGDRHGLATWRLMGSLDGGEWTDLGLVWPDGDALGGRQWAGSAMIDPDTMQVTMYYTALGDLPSNETLTGGPATDPYEDVYWTGGDNIESGGPNRQQMVAVTAELSLDGDAPSLADMGDHEIILTADGEIYRTADQAAALEAPYVFRDPWWFQDPDTGREYLLFSASPAFLTDDAAGGVVGLAMLGDDGNWMPLQPILASPGVNNQLERPHLVRRDGLTYLFVSTHGFSFLGDLDAPPGLYGFVSNDGLGSQFTALNDGGLVLATPASAEQQTYSWVVLPSGAVLSFANYFDLEGVGGLDGIGAQTPEWQREHFGGTLVPLVQLELNGAETAIVPSP